MKNSKILFLSVMTLGSVVGLMGREVDFSSFVVGNRHDEDGRTVIHHYAANCDRSPEELRESYFKAINERSTIEDITENEVMRASKAAYELYMNARKAEEKKAMKDDEFDAEYQVLVEDKFGQTPIDIVKQRINEVNPGVERERCENMLARFNTLLKK